MEPRSISLEKDIQKEIDELTKLFAEEKKNPTSKIENDISSVKTKIFDHIKNACDNRMRVVVKVEDNNFCFKCKNRSPINTFACDHCICRDCLIGEMKRVTEDNFDKRAYSLFCLKCKAPLDRDGIISLVSCAEVTAMAKRAEEYSKKFICPICMCTIKNEDSMVFTCKHRINIGCLKAYLKDLIDKGKVDNTNFVCPYDDCGKELGNGILTGLLTDELVEKMTRFRLKRQKVNNSNEIYISCALCDVGVFLDENVETFVCENPKCERKEKRVCPKCSRTAHEGITCDKYFVDEEEKDRIKEFKEEAMKLGYKPCPVCNRSILKADGGNLMTCQTPECLKNNVYFCYLCGKQLTAEQHLSHYEKHDRFGSKCNTIMGIPE